MITPLFSVSQTTTELQLRIRAPHSRPRDIELSADNHEFHFHTSPYLLHLRFEHPITLPEQSPFIYDLETGIATITLSKTPPHPHFTRLDMLSTLLVSRPTERVPPSIEVLSSTTTTSQATETAITSQQTTTDAGVHLALRELSIGRPRYGFAQRYEAIFASRAEDVSEIVQLPNPDTTPVWRRPALRKEAEDRKFCPDHYLADCVWQDEYAHVLQFQPSPPDVAVRLPDRYVDVMLKLPRREYLPEADVGAAADLAGVLFASAYDVRFTLGERNVESPWTVSRICATMSMLEGFRTAREAVLAAYRRSLAYPLWRSAVLADKVLGDVKMLVDVRETDVLRARLLRVLLELRELFEDDKMLRLHCDLFLIDYCVWIQTVGDDVLAGLREDILAIQIGRKEVGWNLDELEAKAARIVDGEDVSDDNSDLHSEAENDNIPEENIVEDSQAREDKIQPEVTISALSQYPMPELKMQPVVTRKIDQEMEPRLGLENEEENTTVENIDVTSEKVVENNEGQTRAAPAEVTISALPGYLSPELMMQPVATRKLD